MACRTCGTTLPLVRQGLPTIYAFGPFPGYEEIDYDELEDYGFIQGEDQDD